MEIGVCGKPNSGKSTFFSAATLIDVPIQDYPFTTIKPNVGFSHVRVACVCKELGVKCTPKHGRCVNGNRFLPIKMIDVAGLVPGAHAGRGLGNQFLTDLSTADCLIHVIDVSGRTDLEGKPSKNTDPAEEVMFLEKEIAYWIKNIIDRNWQKIKGRGIEKIIDIMNSLKIENSVVKRVIKRLDLSTERIDWDDEERFSFSENIMREGKPIIIAANKIDVAGSDKNLKQLIERFPDRTIIPTCALGELLLRRGAKKGLLDYLPGDKEFSVLTQLTAQQEEALERIRKIMKKYGGLGVQRTINTAVLKMLGYIVVYPVEDENLMADSAGNILPDAILMKTGSTVLQLAKKIHTEIAEGFVTALNVRTKKRVGKDYILNDRDIIKIIAK